MYINICLFSLSLFFPFLSINLIIIMTVIMAQLGCYVPASSCSLSSFDRIFVRAGAQDDIGLLFVFVVCLLWLRVVDRRAIGLSTPLLNYLNLPHHPHTTTHFTYTQPNKINSGRTKYIYGRTPGNRKYIGLCNQGFPHCFG